MFVLFTSIRCFQFYPPPPQIHDRVHQYWPTVLFFPFRKEILIFERERMRKRETSLPKRFASICAWSYFLWTVLSKMTQGKGAEKHPMLGNCNPIPCNLNLRLLLLYQMTYRWVAKLLKRWEHNWPFCMNERILNPKYFRQICLILIVQILIIKPFGTNNSNHDNLSN